jgi:hypothetical protein
VAAQILARGVHDQVGAEVERSLPERRGEGVVDGGDRAGLARGRQEGRQVGDDQLRVGGRLEPEQVGAMGDRLPTGRVAGRQAFH